MTDATDPFHDAVTEVTARTIVGYAAVFANGCPQASRPPSDQAMPCPAWVDAFLTAVRGQLE